MVCLRAAHLSVYASRPSAPPAPAHTLATQGAHTHTHTHTHIHTHTQYTHDHIPALHIAARTLTDTSSMDAFSPAAGAAVLPAFAPPTSAPATFEVQHTVGHM
jgi:hypothetical protein